MFVYRRPVLPDANDYSHSADAGEAGNDGSLVSMTEYHQQFDKPILDIQYNQSGLPEQQTEYIYDGNGFLISEILREADGTVSEERSFQPDQQQRLCMEFRHYADGTFDTLEYAYDDKGRVIKKTLTDDEGVLESKEVFLYEHDRLISESVYDGDGELLSEVHFSYDEDGLLEEKVSDNLEEETYVRLDYLYNEDGVREAILAYDKQGELVERHMFTMDSEGRPIRVVEENKQKKNTIDFTYDERGNVILHEERDIRGDLVNRMERIYDADGMADVSNIYAVSPMRGIVEYSMKYRYEFYEEN